MYAIRSYYDGAERRTAVAHARKRRNARALELQVVALAVAADDFAEQDRAAVAEARIPDRISDV